MKVNLNLKTDTGFSGWKTRVYLEQLWIYFSAIYFMISKYKSSISNQKVPVEMCWKYKIQSIIWRLSAKINKIVH